MRHLTILTAALLSILVLSGCDESKDTSSKPGAAGSASSTTAAPEVRLLGVEKGWVEYRLTGQFEGTETTYWDRWGARRATWTRRRMTGHPGLPEEHKLTLHEGRFIHNIDLTGKSGLRMTHPLWDRLLTMSPAEREQAIKRFGAAMGGQPAGRGDVLGRTCEILEVSTMKLRSWTWRGLTLRTESQGIVKMSSVAVRMAVDVDPPADKLRIPAGIEVVDFKGLKGRMGTK